MSIYWKPTCILDTVFTADQFLPLETLQSSEKEFALNETIPLEIQKA